MQTSNAVSTIDEREGIAGTSFLEPAANQWEDIELSGKARKTCQEISRRASAGKRVTALFSGPGGSGKTRAAGLLARELDRQVLHVRLSELRDDPSCDPHATMDALLSSADPDSTVLLFDEADALFGRGRVEDENCSQALEAELLRCMDEYPGLAILAAHQCRRIDPAVVRRLHYAVKI